MNADDFLDALNIRLGDSDNFSFTAEEKQAAIVDAIKDDSVCTPVWDTSLTFAYSTYQYAKPVDVVQDIYVRASNTADTEPQKIDSSLWEVVRDSIQFKNNANNVIPTGYTLFIRGRNKYSTADTIVETNVQEYVLNLAQLNCLKTLGLKKTLKFLKNDTSLSEVIAMKRELERQVQQYRQRLPRQFEVA